MESSRKHLVKCLVENSNRGFTDIISGKGGGCVFLLHGPRKFFIFFYLFLFIFYFFY